MPATSLEGPAVRPHQVLFGKLGGGERPVVGLALERADAVVLVGGEQVPAHVRFGEVQTVDVLRLLDAQARIALGQQEVAVPDPRRPPVRHEVDLVPRVLAPCRLDRGLGHPTFLPATGCELSAEVTPCSNGAHQRSLLRPRLDRLPDPRLRRPRQRAARHLGGTRARQVQGARAQGGAPRRGRLLVVQRRRERASRRPHRHRRPVVPRLRTGGRELRVDAPGELRHQGAPRRHGHRRDVPPGALPERHPARGEDLRLRARAPGRVRPRLQRLAGRVLRRVRTVVSSARASCRRRASTTPSPR